MPYYLLFQRRGRAAQLRARWLLIARTGAAAALAAACLPEQELSSYGPGLPAQVNARAIGSEPVDAGSVEMRSSRLVADAGAEPAGSSVDAAPSTSTPAPRLACRPECECELRDGQDFMFCATRVTHAQATAQCQGAGGSLVSIEGASQNDWLGRRMAELADDNYWTSGTDSEDEGVWRWADGRVFYGTPADAAAVLGFVPWDDGQPNNVNGEDCMRVIGGLWRDLDCDDEIAFVCER